MQSFDLKTPKTLTEAVDQLPSKRSRTGAQILAGGQDVLTVMKDDIASPSALVDISGLDLGGVKADAAGGLAIGATTTIQEIAGRAHVSKPLFYRQFENKQDVFEAVVDRIFSDWRKALVTQVASTDGSVGEALRVLFVGALEYGRQRPLLGRMLNRDSQLLISTQSDVWDRACRALRDLTTEILKAGVEAGEVRVDLPIEAMADLLTEIHFAFANRQLHTGQAVEHAEAISACMLGGVLRTG